MIANSSVQPWVFTTYTRDGIGSDDAQQRRYNRYYARFEQPDPFDGSYNLTNPQSLNRYSYTENDPVNFIDPSGLSLVAVRVCQVFGVYPTDGRGNVLGPQVGDDILICYSVFIEVGGNTGRRLPPDLGDMGGLGAISLPQQTRQQQKDPCPPHVRKFFNEVGEIANHMKEQTGADVNHFLALSSYESGWLNQHNQGLKNPFGLTQAGGRNLSFGSYREAADLWLKMFGDKVKGSRTIEEFTTNLQKPPAYNSVNKDWYKKVTQQDAVIQKFRKICGV